MGTAAPIYVIYLENPRVGVVAISTLVTQHKENLPFQAFALIPLSGSPFLRR